MFSSGERVLCVRSGWGQFGTGPNPWGVRWPTRGRIYTIRACWQAEKGAWWVHLHEIVNEKTAPQPDGTRTEPVFQADQFVPIKRADTTAEVGRLLALGKTFEREKTHGE